MPFRTCEEAVTRFLSDMARLLDIVESLPGEQRSALVSGGWRVRDVLVHIAGWDRLLAASVDELLAGERPSLAKHSSRKAETEFNERIVAESRDLSFADALGAMQEAHAALIGRLGALSEEEWQRASARRWGNETPMTVASLFDYSYKGETHYGGHATELEAWAASER